MSVTQCVCHQISFKEIKEFAEKENITSIEELQFLSISSTKCKRCKPYIKEMLRNGRTTFMPKPVNS